MIGGLQYLTHRKPDIANVVGIVARLQDNPREYHYLVLKRISRYLKGTSDYRIWYDRGNDFTLCTYTNFDWVGDMDDRNRTNGGAFFLGGRLVSCLTKKKNCISQSTTKIEYVVATNNCNQVIWMKKMLKDIGIFFEELVIIYYKHKYSKYV